MDQIIEQESEKETYAEGASAEQKQPPRLLPAPLAGTKRQSLLDTLMSSDASLPSAVRSVLRDGASADPMTGVDEMTGPGSCKLNFEAPSKQRAGVEAVIEFSVPGSGTVHKDKLFVGNALKRSRFIASCVEAIKGTNAAPNENELRAWLEKRLLKIARDAEVISETKSIIKEIPVVEGKQRKEATALLKDPSLLYQAGHCLTLLGVVGEQINALLLYLALSSRLLDTLLSCVIKSESSAGKSFLVDNVLKLFPSEAYHFVSGMSRQSLVYSQENLKNKMIVIAEAPGMEACEFNLRTLLSEGRLIFETAEKSEVTGRYETRRVEKEGPTGLILTTTKPQLHVENETRYLSLSVDESQAQTRRIMEATARKFARATVAGAIPDLTKWINAQRLLRSVKVEVPYSSQLLAKLPAKPLRMRRDSQKLLTAISACALLHQEQRECRGNVVKATLADYYIVKRLLEPVFFGSLHGIPAKTREVMEAIKELYKAKNSQSASTSASAVPLEVFVTTQELAERLKWSKKTVLKWAEQLNEFEWAVPGPHENSPCEFRPGYEPKVSKFPGVEELLGEWEKIEVIDPISGETVSFGRERPREGSVEEPTEEKALPCVTAGEKEAEK